MNKMDPNAYDNWVCGFYKNFSISDGEIIATFNYQYHIPLNESNTQRKALNQALAFSALIFSDGAGLLPADSLAHYLLLLIARAYKFKVDARSLYSGYDIEYAGTFSSITFTYNNKDQSVIEFKLNESVYLHLIKQAEKGSNSLYIKKNHCYTSNTYQFIEIPSVGLVITDRCIFLSLPIGSIWHHSCTKHETAENWCGRNSIRIALMFEDIDTLNSSVSKLYTHLGKNFFKQPSWSKYLTNQTSRRQKMQ